MSTHSSVIASETREDSLFLVKKRAGATQLERFTDKIADELVEEMGIRPLYNFESNTVLFVEGKFDEKVYTVWMKRYELRSSLIESGGYSNVQSTPMRRYCSGKPCDLRSSLCLTVTLSREATQNRLKNS